MKKETEKKPVEFYQWKQISLDDGDKDDADDKEREDADNSNAKTKRLTLTKVTSTMIQAVELLKDMCEELPFHLFVARWQQSQFKQVSKDPGQYHVFIQDFAQNVTIKYQNEVQSAHWTHSLTTLHPIICIYKCI